LDEPTNHLDLESTQWLVEFLTGYSGTLVVVSHDHYFLDTIVEQVAWLTLGKVRTYVGNYSAFLRTREQEETQLLRAYENQQRELARAERFIERFRYKATKASAVQSRIKQLEKIARIELPRTVGHVHLRLPEPLPSAKTVLELRNVSKKYSGQTVLRDVTLRFDAGDKIAVLGRNGSGKSTLLQICAGIEPFEGQRFVAAKTEIGYFAQSHAETLDLGATVLEVAASWASNLTEEQLRTFLGAFLFCGEDVFKPVHVLSGGEKTRLALARLLLKPANLLLLDEPTNHLDITTRKILLEALKQYRGTVVFVSHDRYFIEQLATKILLLDATKATLFYTTFKGFLERQQRERDPNELEESSDLGRSRAQAASAKNKKTEIPRQNPLVLERKLRTQRRVQIKTQLDALEQEIEFLEARLTEIESLQADPDAYSNGIITPEICIEADSIRRKLPELIQQWEKLVDEYETIRRSPV
jgi:ATP-binding cassette subfamily F protein 3